MKCPKCKHEFEPFRFKIPEWLDREAWHHWLTYRNKFNQPFTDRAKTIAINKLKELKDKGYDPAEVIDYCINKPWQGIYEPKELGFKKVIEREKINEAKKRIQAIPRKPNKRAQELRKGIKAEMVAIAKKMRSYSTTESLIARSRYQQLKDQLLSIDDSL